MKIIKKPSPNHDERRDKTKPSFLIFHYTGMKTAQEALDRLCDATNANPVSAHYVVDEDGTIYALVDEDRRAWHAGRSYWDGVEDINSHSIGIEVVNPGHEFGYRPFPAAQVKALIALCQDIVARHDIPAHRVLAHSDIAPDRKTDPGELFDWQHLAGKGIGLWPVPLKEDFEKAAAFIANENTLRHALHEAGYDPRATLKDAIIAFQRHFYPDAFKAPQQAGIADENTAARLHAFLRMKRDR